MRHATSERDPGTRTSRSTLPSPSCTITSAAWPGLFQKLSDGIRYVRDEQAKQGIDFPIIIKPTVGKKNYQYLPDMVRWVKEIGATGMNLQPMDRWTPETYDELWIEADEHAELQKVVDTLIAMKRQGEPIINSELLISLLVPHFREESAPPDVMPCRVGMRDFFIRTNGDIEVCFFYPPIGNIKENSARDDLVRPQGPGHPSPDRRVRSALSLHMPLSEDLERQVQDGADAAQIPAEEWQTRKPRRDDRTCRLVARLSSTTRAVSSRGAPSCRRGSRPGDRAPGRARIRGPQVWRGSGGRGSVRAWQNGARTEPRPPERPVVLGTLRR